jgi:hypothetical protein
MAELSIKSSSMSENFGNIAADRSLRGIFVAEHNKNQKEQRGLRKELGIQSTHRGSGGGGSSKKVAAAAAPQPNAWVAAGVAQELAAAKAALAEVQRVCAEQAEELAEYHEQDEEQLRAEAHEAAMEEEEQPPAAEPPAAQLPAAQLF